MKTLQRAIVSWAALALIILAVSTCASASNPLTSPTEFDSLVPGWQSKFSLDFKVQPSKDGTNILYGQIYSHYGQFASRLLHGEVVLGHGQQGIVAGGLHFCVAGPEHLAGGQRGVQHWL